MNGKDTIEIIDMIGGKRSAVARARYFKFRPEGVVRSFNVE